MRLRHVLVTLAIAAFSVAGIAQAASSEPLTKQNFTLTRTSTPKAARSSRLGRSTRPVRTSSSVTRKTTSCSQTAP